MSERSRPEIEFVPLSTNPAKIRFFGALMPALLLVKASPAAFARHQVMRHTTPHDSIARYIATGADDLARVNNTFVFVHRWHTPDFDPLAFARARTFLARLVRLLRREGCPADPVPPLSSDVNLPRLAAQAGLGNLSPFGLLVHPAFGPRMILSALHTPCALAGAPRSQCAGCTDCLACLEVCPQAPMVHGVVDLGACQRCAQCLAVCPVGKSQTRSQGG